MHAIELKCYNINQDLLVHVHAFNLVLMKFYSTWYSSCILKTELFEIELVRARLKIALIISVNQDESDQCKGERIIYLLQ